MKKGKLIFTAFVCSLTFLFATNVHAATPIADEFEESFVNAVMEQYDITREEFTDEWAKQQTELVLNGKEIGGIDKGGVNEHVLAAYFPNLEILDLGNNSLGGLPNFPATLKTINVEDNNITGLPNLPATLETLNVSGNKLVALPDLPTTLVSLVASDNELPGLPALPANLEVLNVSNNKLPGLPDLPATLETLNVSNNELPGLPAFPAALKSLDISNNQIPDILPLPEGLKSFDMSNNLFTSLPTLPGGLTTLDITGNEIKEVLLSQLPETLETFNSDVEVTDDITAADDTQEKVEEENPETSDGILLFIGIAVVGLAGTALAYRRLHN